MTNAADRDVLFARVPSVDQQVHRLQVRLALSFQYNPMHPTLKFETVSNRQKTKLVPDYSLRAVTHTILSELQVSIGGGIYPLSPWNSQTNFLLHL